MILDRSIGSARAERHRNHAGQRIIGNLLTATLALALVLASFTNLAAGKGSPQLTAERAHNPLPLPPIQYLESIPWMNWNAPAPTLRIDTLVLPGFTPWVDPRNPQTKGSRAFS